MEVNSISFNGKAPKINTVKQPLKNAIENAIGQTNKDYFMLTRKPEAKQEITPDFIEKAKKFFADIWA